MASKDQKKELLLQSFNVLNNNLEDNSSKIAEIIQKMSKIDFQTAWEMWTFILENWDVRIYSNETFYYSSGLVMDFVNSIGIEKIAKQMLADSFICKKIYYESSQPDSKIIAYFIDTNQLEYANQFLDYVYSNPNHNEDEDDPFGYYLDYLLSVECDNLSKKNVEFILPWVERVKSNTYKAKIHVTLIDYI